MSIIGIVSLYLIGFIRILSTSYLMFCKPSFIFPVVLMTKQAELVLPPTASKGRNQRRNTRRRRNSFRNDSIGDVICCNESKKDVTNPLSNIVSSKLFSLFTTKNLKFAF